MKTIATLILTLFIGVAGFAQTATKEVQVNVIEINSVIEKSTAAEKAVEEDVIIKNTSVARLYKCKNYRVKKALSFTTKRSRSKMA